MSYRFYTALRRSIILPDCIHGGRIKGVCGALFVFLLSDCFISAATVSLEGTVTTGAGVGIAGASVTLAKEKTLSAKTDAQGAFTLSGETGVGVDRSPLFGKPQFPFALSGNRLVITPAFETADGRVEIFSHDGRRSAAVVYRGSKAGKRTVGLPEFASGLTIIRITIGKESFTRTLIRVGDGVDYSGRDTRLTGRSGEFTLTGQASAAAVDTLIAAKSGFTEVKTPIDSYEKKGIAIVMQEDGPVGEMSLVYDKEFTGEDCPKPALVADPTALPSIDCLPDPFLNADGSRITKKAEWRCRRAEIKAILEKYDAGEKPAKPEKFEATLSGNTVTIQCGVGSNSITLTASISRPRNATDPCPAIIGINAATGSLPSDIFSSRGIAAITFTSSQIMGDGMFSSAPRNSGNFYKLYPQTTAGSMIRWAWGVSRIIDALEVLPEAKIDTRRLAVSGCSYQGKIALFAGAWDERIALTIPHESGG
ncbi:MAG: carboxypeptidase regulatory-like domain-containing protein, partial [Chitinispirillaceae bacterium]|nr:carboxypeptidase regulatory-like domain-containing protein [Chitinispirillaceae bacterium]